MMKPRDYQTPLKELSRASEAGGRRSKESQPKKPLKVAKRSLAGEFTITEDVSAETAGDGCGSSEITDADHSNELIENALLLSPATSATSPIAPLSSDVSLNSKVNKVSPNGAHKLVDLAKRPAEAAIIISLLRKVQSEAPIDTNNRYKKILEELIKVVVDEYRALPEERDWMMKLLSWKRGVVVLCLLTWSFTVWMLIFFGAGYGGGSDSGIAPT